MNEAAVKKIKEAALRDFQKSSRNVQLHTDQMNDPSSTPEYRRAIKEALEVWNLLKEAAR